ncbi:MAG TPA: hypothetical protein VIC32_03800, partial [Terriglobales bacterium]
MVLAIGVSPLAADTTMRTHITFKSGGMVPAQMLAAFQAMAKGAGSLLPSEVVLETQGTKARTEGAGMGITIVDLANSQVTVLNPATKR